MSQPPDGFEREKWKYELEREDAKRAHDQHTEFMTNLNEAAIKSGELALRTILIVNGGAAAALLAFIGGMASQGKIQVAQLGMFSVGLIWFSYGVIASAVGVSASYLVHFFMGGAESSKLLTWDHPYVKDSSATKWWLCARHCCHALAVLAALAAIVFFFVGMLDIRASIQKLK